AIVQISYQPPVTRLNFPGGNQDFLFIGVGLADSGSGLKVVRRLQHQDNASGSQRSATGINITDPAGFSPSANGFDAEAPAAYDTTYTVSASLDQTTRISTCSLTAAPFCAV